jgi:hypothetical protein
MQAANHLRLALTTRQMRYGPCAMITAETQLLLADALKGSACPACMDEAEMLSASAPGGYATSCDKSPPCGWSDSLEAPHGFVASSTYSDLSVLCALHRGKHEGEVLRVSVAQSVHRELTLAPHEHAATLHPPENYVSAATAFMDKTDLLAKAVSNDSSCSDSMPLSAGSQQFHIPSSRGLQSSDCGGHASRDISRFDIRPKRLGTLPKSVTFNPDTAARAPEWDGASWIRRLSSTSRVPLAL